MEIDRIRAYCLSLPHATEDIKPEWGDALLFRIAGKIFVSVGLGDVPVQMSVKCTPERCAELLEVEGVRRADYLGRYDWITFAIAEVFRDAELRELIRQSYDNIRARLPKRVAENLASPLLSKRSQRKTVRRA